MCICETIQQPNKIEKRIQLAETSESARRRHRKLNTKFSLIIAVGLLTYKKKCKVYVRVRVCVCVLTKGKWQFEIRASFCTERAFELYVVDSVSLKVWLFGNHILIFCHFFRIQKIHCYCCCSYLLILVRRSHLHRIDRKVFIVSLKFNFVRVKLPYVRYLEIFFLRIIPPSSLSSR